MQRWKNLPTPVRVGPASLYGVLAFGSGDVAHEGRLIVEAIG